MYTALVVLLCGTKLSTDLQVGLFHPLSRDLCAPYNATDSVCCKSTKLNALTDNFMGTRCTDERPGHNITVL